MAARRSLPAFAYEYGDGGAGWDGGISRNWHALDCVELVPRYGERMMNVDTSVELFGRRYAAPIGVAPMGGPSVVLPGADGYLAASAEQLNVPYVLGMVGGITIEQAATLAPSVLWLQLYPMPKNDHARGYDLVRRAEAANVNVLVLTMDCPVRTTRPREVLQGVTTPFRVTPAMALSVVRSPRWLGAYLKNGAPRFASLERYVDGRPTSAAVTEFARREVRGAFSWDEVARYRDWWKDRPVVVKGLLHPADAERAISLGIDGVWVSNHGGRQVDALPASIDMLPELASAIDGRIKVMFDSGVRTGVDVVRAISNGAQMAFAGKAYLWGLGALGARGPGHVSRLIIEEIRSTMAQIGVDRVAALQGVARQRVANCFGANR
ncbi:MAG: alpha-hydroxy-acid oxidizing protein [Mesorhizobium sp.]|nr:alpha-hydroxy-acid oxidizing protein [Mesorhizobium sp.]